VKGLRKGGCPKPVFFDSGKGFLNTLAAKSLVWQEIAGVNTRQHQTTAGN
jgi:hypothetical protein